MKYTNNAQVKNAIAKKFGFRHDKIELIDATMHEFENETFIDKIDFEVCRVWYRYHAIHDELEIVNQF